MKAQILHIGVLDNTGRVHAVSFKEGVNVITGRSSTGKSALIEIFDYCFGSSDFTVPVGVITECAVVYFTVIMINSSALVLARRSKDSKAFLKEELELQMFLHPDTLGVDYFEEDSFIPLRDFLDELKHYFGVRVTDIDEDLAAKNWRRKKAPTPSIRSFTSYMLQHQNLVANKHAIFYRFDQKEKREQAIDHLKIFLGFADQTYFIKAQELNKLEQEKRVLERSLPSQSEKIEATKKKLKDVLWEYEAISGQRLEIDLARAASAPKIILKEVREKSIEIVSDSDTHVKLKEEVEREQSRLAAELRRKQQELAAVESSIKFSRKYTEQSGKTIVPESAELHASACPFCGTQKSDVEEQANELTEAINWLNSELSRSSYRTASFEEEKRKIQIGIDAIKPELKRCEQQINAAEQQIENIAEGKKQYELSLRAKIRVENILSELSELKEKKTEEDVAELEKKIRELKEYLKVNYDVGRQLGNAGERIRNLLAALSARFNFEDSYTPIRLRFSLESFDLWHETDKGKQVFLRAMGSGANWLSCHLVLFLALQRYFCEVGEKCSIPSILFFDQPSQVYFPSILDGETNFSAEELAKKDTRRDKSRPVDEDVKAVTNLFVQLVKYCEDTKNATGIMPQIIVTDHADHLKLPGDITFDSLVRKRWRQDGQGFIDLSS